MEKGLNSFFEEYLKQEPIFVNKSILHWNYTPDKILHREKQITEIAKILAPSLKLEKPSNLFIYGQTGTGKTCIVKYVTQEMEEIAKKKKLNLKIVYINCKYQRVADTEYRLIAEIIKNLGEKIPTTGLPTKDVYDFFIRIIEDQKILLILIMDEIDHVVEKMGDEMLYTLTRVNDQLKESKISIIGITNDLTFISRLGPRVQSSLSEEEMMFPPYDAIQLKDILEQRAKIGFKKGVLEEGLISKCAALAAKEHGDARRALELLRVAGELAEREGKNTVTMEDVDVAQEKIDRDNILEAVKTSPKQHQLILQSILQLKKQNSKEETLTGQVYEVYKTVGVKYGISILTPRRVSEIISQLSMQGIIQTKLVNKGRYGRSREICVNLASSTVEEIEKILPLGF
ncbi:MAG: orc1/cdc6 family replication initiation protein [Nanoarchaeota archaeon]|nr:orc1/cdc6 family replication initiation protein [Nanoarchaeota archaeon]